MVRCGLSGLGISPMAREPCTSRGTLTFCGRCRASTSLRTRAYPVGDGLSRSSETDRLSPGIQALPLSTNVRQHKNARVQELKMAKASRKDAHMTPTVSPRVQLTTRQRTCLEQIIRRQTSPQRLVRRAKILLALETGANECHVMRQMHLNRGTVRVWRQRWLAFAPKLAQLEADEGSDKTLCTMI